MCKKVGIVTFHNALSYGAVLQSYALQRFMMKNGVDNEIVNYQCDYMNKNYKRLIRIVKGKKLKSFAGSLLQLKNKKKSLQLSKSFQELFLITGKEVTRDNIYKIADEYSLFIAGSDQVWSPDCVGFDKTYFLDFAKPEQKYSYAASFGATKIPEEKTKEYKTLLSDFRDYSVREKSGAELVKNLTGYNARVDIDPTLLLTSDEWDKITSEVDIKRPYIFLFNVLKPKRMIEYAVKLGQTKNMPVYYLNDKHLPINGIKYLNPVSADEFVSIIKNAEYVVTNSFHGSAFSVLYHKKFVMELDTAAKRNTRSEELLKELEIENREICADSDPDPDGFIDWNRVDKILEVKRNYSQDYIRGIKDKLL